MSKKVKANGAANAPVPPILAEDTITTTPGNKKDGKSNGTKTSNGTTPAYGPSEIDGFIDGRQLLKVLVEVRNGNFSSRMPSDGISLSGKIYDTINDIITLNELLVSELTEARKIESPCRIATCCRWFLEYSSSIYQQSDLRPCSPNY